MDSMDAILRQEAIEATETVRPVFLRLAETAGTRLLMPLETQEIEPRDAEKEEEITEELALAA